MKYLLQILLIVFIALFVTEYAYAQKGRGTETEAVELVKKVKGLFKTAGPDKTFKLVSTLQQGLKVRDLYPFIIHMDGYVVAHYISSLRGLNITEVKDAFGNNFFRTLVRPASSHNGKGWSRAYYFPNPLLRKIESKIAYVERLSPEYFVAVGVYKRLKDETVLDR